MAKVKAVAGASAQVKEEIAKIKAELEALKASSDAAKRAELAKRYADFRRKHYADLEPDDEDVEDPIEKPPAEDSGRPQPQKGANPDPAKWKVVPTKDKKYGNFKIVDDDGTNVADMFRTQEGAQKYIDQAKSAGGGPGPGPSPEQPPTTPPEPLPPPTTGGGAGGAGDTPYPEKSARMQSTTRGPTTRNYASGKPSDNTIEKNVKEIEFENYQCVVDITNDCAWAHNDTFSIKLGGTHMGSGWFDNSLDVYGEKGTGLGYEPDHPETHLYVIKGPNVGDTRGKRFKYACTYFTAQNKTELWTDFGDGWKKQCEGTNVGGFKPNSDVDEFQLRIDGFKDKSKPPTIHSAFVTAI